MRLPSPKQMMLSAASAATIFFANASAKATEIFTPQDQGVEETAFVTETSIEAPASFEPVVTEVSYEEPSVEVAPVAYEPVVGQSENYQEGSIDIDITYVDDTPLTYEPVSAAPVETFTPEVPAQSEPTYSDEQIERILNSSVTNLRPVYTEDERGATCAVSPLLQTFNGGTMMVNGNLYASRDYDARTLPGHRIAMREGVANHDAPRGATDPDIEAIRQQCEAMQQQADEAQQLRIDAVEQRLESKQDTYDRLGALLASLQTR